MAETGHFQDQAKLTAQAIRVTLREMSRSPAKTLKWLQRQLKEEVYLCRPEHFLYKFSQIWPL